MGLTQAVIPTALYHLWHSQKNVRRFAEPLFTIGDEEWGQYMGKALKGFSLNLQAPRLAIEANLRFFQSASLVFGGQDFLGEKIPARVQSLVPHAETELIRVFPWFSRCPT